MATTLHRTRLSPATDGYPLDAGRFDEAIAPTGAPRPPNAAVFDALAQPDLAVLRERVRSDPATPGLASARTPLFQALPRVGIQRSFADYAEYVETVVPPVGRGDLGRLPSARLTGAQSGARTN